MKILIIGATGYLGLAAARALRTHGHHIVGLARSDEAYKQLVAQNYDVAVGDVGDAKTLVEPARVSDGVLYVAQLQLANAQEVESLALCALLDALVGSSKPLLYTSGIWYYGSTGEQFADEDTPSNPPPTVASRPLFERMILDRAGQGVRSMVVRPGIVYGQGKGIPSLYVSSARDQGAALTIGNGSNHWSPVHVDDLAELYSLMFERGQAGDVCNATDDTTPTQLEIAQAASRGVGRDDATTEMSLDDAKATFGAWIEGVALDQQVTSARARSRFGWQPRSTTIMNDLESGSYATVAPQ